MYFFLLIATRYNSQVIEGHTQQHNGSDMVLTNRGFLYEHLNLSEWEDQ